MLLNKLYTIRHLEISGDNSSIVADIELNRHHPLFEGHFPGNPVLPGVCTVQIVKELLEESFQRPTCMTKARSIKYLGFVNPVSRPVLNFVLQLNHPATDVVDCTATVSAQGMAVCSMKGEFVDR